MGTRIKDIKVDPPVVLSADYELDRTDRRYIDDQIVAVEQHLVDSLLNGTLCSWYTVDSSGGPITSGMIVSAIGTNVAPYDFSNTTASPLGVAVSSGSPGTKIRVAIGGLVAASITGLSNTTNGYVRVNTATKMPEWVASLTTGDVLVGAATPGGALRLYVGPPASGGGGGGGGTTIPTASVTDSYVTMSTTGVVTVQRITADQIYAAFSVTLAGGGNVEVGSTVGTPAFTVSYGGGTTASATLNDSVPNAGKALTTPFTSVSSNASFTRNTVGAQVTFTVTATSTAGSTKTSGAVALNWLQKNYWGVGTAGQTSAAFILALGSNGLATSKNGSFSATAGAGQKIYFACRSAYGAASFAVGGFSGGFTKTATVSLTNASGFTENYDLYESNTANLGATTFVVS